MLAGTVISAARGRHSAFYKERHPNKVALEFLSAYTKVLYGNVLALDPNAVLVTLTSAMPLVDHAAGIALPANTQLIDEVTATYLATNGPEREPYVVSLIDARQRNAPNAPRGAAWQIGDVLYLRSPASLWQNFASVSYRVSALPGSLTTLEDTLALPDAAELALTEAVAEFFAKREKHENKDSPISVSSFADATVGATTGYLNMVKSNVEGRMFFTEDVWRP